MTTSIPTNKKLDIQLDVFGQVPAQIYTQICLIYPIADASSDAAITETLSAGLERLSESFPWVAGQVVIEDATEKNTGVAKIKTFRKTPSMVVKKVRDDPSAPSLQALRDAGYPLRLLDESLVAPRTTMSTGDEPAEAPCLYLQATFIDGGLILTFVAHHGVMDFIGQAFVMKLLSKACRGEHFTAEEVRIGNADRAGIIPFLSDYRPGPEVAHQIVKPQLTSTASTEVLTPPPPAPCTWANFNFDALALSALEVEANRSAAKGTVSVDDALTALIWQSVTRVRIPRFEESHPSNVKFARAVDVRGVLGIDARYPGCIQNMTYHHYPPHRLVDEPLGVVAAGFHGALEPHELRFRTQALATLLHNTPDKTKINTTASLDLGNDIMLSSWTKVDCYSSLDFNLGLGLPVAVRRPRFAPVEGLVYLGPKAPDGEIVAVMCLREDDMERLLGDREFRKYGRWVG